MNRPIPISKFKSLLCAAALCALAPYVAFPTPSLTVVPAAKADTASLLAPGTDIGMWVWHKEPVINPVDREQLLQFCEKFGITRIFVQVRFEEAENGFRLKDTEAWNALLDGATKSGVKVDALDGAGHMGFASHRPETLARLDAVLNFQTAQPESARFAGVHYDIEPYVTKRWKTEERSEVILELLDTMTEIKKSVEKADPSMTIAHDIPFWYSGRDEFKIEYNGSEKYLDEHILDLSDFMGIMSYRTKMTGGNSTSAIASEELEYAAATSKKVYPSLETVRLNETPTITFHGRQPSELVEAIRELNSHLMETPGYGGIFLHTYRTARPMLEEWDTARIELASNVETGNPANDTSE